MPQPLLFSFRRCPYAIRARLALLYAEQSYTLHEVSLKEKPAQLLDISPKATVPVLLLPDGAVLDQSLDISLWALRQNDPHNFLPAGDELNTSLALIADNDGEFKHWLDLYKYADRHPQHSQVYYREKAENFLARLELQLKQSNYLQFDHPCLTDIAVLPFVRQFAAVDKSWFDTSPHPNLQRWLEQWLKSPSFLQVMQKYSKHH